MKPNTIFLTDRGIECFEAPEKPENYVPNRLPIKYDFYRQALEAAMKQSVLFKDKAMAIRVQELIEFNNNKGVIYMIKGKLYPVPEGYEIKIENLEEFINPQTESGKHTVQYAVLVPKQESFDFHCGDEADGDIRCDRQCKDCKGESLDRIKELRKVEKGAGDDYPVYSTGNKLHHGDTTESISKQPTSIEEAAETYILLNYVGGVPDRYTKRDFIAGAKHQEGIAVKFGQWIREKIASSYVEKKTTQELFEQFKAENK